MSQKLRWVLRMPSDVFWVAVWKSSGAQISSNLVSLENSGCLVSIGSNLMPFGVIVVKISCLEHSQKKKDIMSRRVSFKLSNSQVLSDAMYWSLLTYINQVETFTFIYLHFYN